MTEPFIPLLVLYFWPFSYFKDANKGSKMEKAAALRHNIEMAVFLPRYIRRWVFLITIWYSMVWLFDVPNSWLIWVSSGFGVLCASNICMLLVLSMMYLLLTRKTDS